MAWRAALPLRCLWVWRLGCRARKHYGRCDCMVGESLPKDNPYQESPKYRSPWADFSVTFLPRAVRMMILELLHFPHTRQCGNDSRVDPCHFRSRSQDLENSFEIRMPSLSRYAGQTANTSIRRSVRLIDECLTEESIDEPFLIVDHFFHENSFWRARIPLNSVVHVFGQAFNFSKIKFRNVNGRSEPVLGRDGIPKRKIPQLNHVQSRFLLSQDSPVELFPLGKDIDGEPWHLVQDFVYSIEAVGPEGVNFNLRDALGGHLLSMHRFMSTRQMVFERVVVEGQYVTESPPLPLTESSMRALLVKSLFRSHRAGTGEAYYMYRCCATNNCTSNPFQILDRVVSYPMPYRLGAFLYRLPLSPRFYLRVRGLDTDSSVRKLVRDEFQDYVQDPETKKQKRAYVRQMTQAVRKARQAQQAEDS